MSTIETRLKKMEQVLHVSQIGRIRAIVLFDKNCQEQKALPRHVKDWVTYQQSGPKPLVRRPGPYLKILFASDEVAARKAQGVI